MAFLLHFLLFFCLFFLFDPIFANDTTVSGKGMAYPSMRGARASGEQYRKFFLFYFLLFWKRFSRIIDDAAAAAVITKRSPRMTSLYLFSPTSPSPSSVTYFSQNFQATFALLAALQRAPAMAVVLVCHACGNTDSLFS